MHAARLVPALALLAACATTGSPPAPTAPKGLPFVTDVEVARAEALRRGVPIFVDAWAPW